MVRRWDDGQKPGVSQIFRAHWTTGETVANARQPQYPGRGFRALGPPGVPSHLPTARYFPAAGCLNPRLIEWPGPGRGGAIEASSSTPSPLVPWAAFSRSAPKPWGELTVRSVSDPSGP